MNSKRLSAISRLLLLVFVFQVSALSQETRIEPVPAQTKGTATERSTQSKEVKISAGDLIDISVFGVPELARVTRVSSTGKVSLPLIGNVEVANLTAEEAQERIAKEFETQNFLRAPQITVFVKEYATQGISVLGEVSRAGIYPLFGSVRLLDAISAAGGTTSRAGKRITISHRNPAISTTTVLMDGSDQSNVELLPGDTVMVSKAGVVYVVGNVEKPGGFLMDNNEKLTVLQAIALAQGANKTASLDKTVLIRTTTMGRQEIPVPLKRILASQSPDLPLQSDDIIFVPNSASKNVAKRTMDAVLATLPGVAVYTAAR